MNLPDDLNPCLDPGLPPSPHSGVVGQPLAGGVLSVSSLSRRDQTKRWLSGLKWEKHLHSEDMTVSLALEPPQLLALCVRNHMQD